MASVKNLASGTLVSGINVGDTTLTVAVGSGTSEELLAVWPTPPFYITVAPDSPASGVSNALDSEIMSVTAIAYPNGNIVMTVTRAQRGTTAKAFNADAIVTNAVYAEDAVLLGPNGTTESPSPWIQSGDIEDEAVTANKIDWTPVTTVVTDFETGFSGAAMEPLRVRKFGKIVQVTGGFTVNTEFTERYMIFCTLPAGYWPSFHTAAIIVGPDGNTYSFCNVRSDGKIAFLGSKSTANTIAPGVYQISAFYMIN